MFGKLTYMELRSGLKGILLLLIIMFVIAYGMVQIFPSFQESFLENLEGEQNIDINVPENIGEEIVISWNAQEKAVSYTVLEDNLSYMLTPTIIYEGKDNIIHFVKEYTEKRYYAVIGTESTGDRFLIGIVSTVKDSTPFNELMENPIYSGFTGGRMLNMAELTGFLGVEFFSWWWMFAGVIIGYLAVTKITTDYEGKRMDLMFSTPLSRWKYLLEKYLTMIIISIAIVIISFLGLYSGVVQIGQTEQLSADIIFLSTLGFIPFLMFISAIGILTAVYFRRTSIGIGITLGFLFAQFFMYTISGLSSSLDVLKSISIFTYWDYYAVLLEGNFKTMDSIGLVCASLLVVMISLYVFNKKDIPT